MTFHYALDNYGIGVWRLHHPKEVDGKMACQDSRYDKKLAILHQSKSPILDPYEILDTKWIDDPKKWPSLEFPQVYTYLIDSPGIFTKESLKLTKV